jgi:hypothetical protein
VVATLDHQKRNGFATQFVAAWRAAPVIRITDKFRNWFKGLVRLIALDSFGIETSPEEPHEMSRRRLLPVVGAAAGLSAFALVPAATAGCGGWGCQPACEAPARFGSPVVSAPVVPCAGRFYPLQPVYRVEQGPIHNVVIVPYEEPHLRFVYLPPLFFADCACYR